MYCFKMQVELNTILYTTTVSKMDNQHIVIFLSFWTDRSGQTVQTQIRLLEEQSDQGLQCLQFPLHLLDALL